LNQQTIQQQETIMKKFIAIAAVALGIVTFGLTGNAKADHRRVGGWGGGGWGGGHHHHGGNYYGGYRGGNWGGYRGYGSSFIISTPSFSFGYGNPYRGYGYGGGFGGGFGGGYGCGW
jgi:hypothetical protein